MRRLGWFVLGLALLAVAFMAGTLFATRETIAASSADGGHLAWASDRRCASGRCEVLWIGSSRSDATTVATLEGEGRCHEIVWTRDGRKVAFLIDGTELRFYDASSLLPAGQLTLVPPQSGPRQSIVRGVTFSDNGRAITYDECPVGKSGCRAGFAAVPQ